MKVGPVYFYSNLAQNWVLVQMFLPLTPSIEKKLELRLHFHHNFVNE